MKKVKLTVTIDENVSEILKKLSNDLSLNKSKFVNKIIIEYLKNNKQIIDNR